MSETVTLLFTDIEASTAQWECSNAMHQVVEEHFAILRQTVEAHDGAVFASMGDGIGAAFTSVEQAVRASVAAQLRLIETGLRVRMALHTGEAHRVGGDYRGRTPNRAARLMSVAHGRQILLSDITAGLVRAAIDDVELIDLGPHRLRDLAEPEHIWQVCDPSLPQAFPPPRGMDLSAVNLPMPRSTFVGRDHELRRVANAIRHHRVVTLTGVGGVGKTRLSIHAAADMAEDFSAVWFVALDTVDDPDDVLSAVALAAGVPPRAAVIDDLAMAFRGRRILILLDNCEHLVDAAAKVADELTERCPDLHILATSREPLAIDGEQIIPVRPLDIGQEAVELFEQRAVAGGASLEALPRWALAQICARLDGLPLAIELAASRAQSLGLAAIAEALDDQLSLLAGGRRRAVERHQTMRATVEWSYRMLDRDEQCLFLSMAVFSGGFEMDAVRFIAARRCFEDQDIHLLLDSLVRKCMFEVDELPTGTRYRMLQTVRAYALEVLHADAGHSYGYLDVADWVATLTDYSFDDLGSAAVEANAIRLEREADNWRLAISEARRLGDGEMAGRLCGPPTAYFLLGRHDLADDLRQILEWPLPPMARRSVLTSYAISQAGLTDAAQLSRWATEIATIEGDQPSGVADLVEWMARGWSGDRHGAVALCLRAADAPQLSASARDLFLGIAATERFSFTDVVDDRDGLVRRALDIVERSPVATHRVICSLGVAWAHLPTDPMMALHHVHAALDEMPRLPSYLQRTLPGNASRLLAELDPRLAAEELSRRLRDSRPADSFVSLIPAFYAAALLYRIDHPLTGSAMSTLAQSAVAKYFTLFGWEREAVVWRMEHEPMDIGQLFDALIDALIGVQCSEPAQWAGRQVSA